jgi:hypothetical protein
MSADPGLGREVPDILQFRPRWWWDPVPEWVLGHLEREQIVEIAAIQLEAHRSVLEQQMGAVDKTLSVLRSR